MMKDCTRVALINKEIETYRKIAAVLGSLKPTIHLFDGKCINKKFTEALDDFLKYGKEKHVYSISAEINATSYGTFFDMAIHCYDDIVKGEPDKIGYCSNYYISNRDISMRINADEVTTKTSENGKPRINAKALSEKIDEKIQTLHNKADELEKDLSHVEEMKADMEHIKQLMALFNSKYHGRVSEVFNCNYFLKDNNGMQYR